MLFDDNLGFFGFTVPKEVKPKKIDMLNSVYDGFIKGNMFKDEYSGYKNYKPCDISATSEREKFKNDINIAYEYFGSIDELVEANRHRPHLRQYEDHTSSKYLSRSFNGCETYREAEDMALNGWNKILEDTEFKSFYYNGGIETEKMVKPINDVVGYVPIVPNVLLGIPQTMINFSRKKVKSKILHIVYSITVPAYIGENRLTKIGFEFMKAVVNLEKQGYRLRLTAMQEYSEDDNTDILFMKVKDEFKKMDLQSSMFNLIHPAVFRTIGFVWKERSPICKEMCGYGSTFKSIHESDKKLIENIKEILKDKNLIYVSANEILDDESTTDIDIENMIFKKCEGV